MSAVVNTSLKDYLPLLATGKVREIYAIDESTLLFVATDRISAYDVVMSNAIDGKGRILTQLSAFWFELFETTLPSVRTHYIHKGLPPAIEARLPPDLAEQVRPRSMTVRRLKVFPLESIVRGYITGSAWASYCKDGTVHGVKLPAGLRESDKLDPPMWTPSTKAELGEKDENISKAEAARIVGQEYADQIEALSLAVYKKANEHAAERGIILADTKFEFALDESTSPPTVVLVDEVLTPDSSRFWGADKYKVGQSQDSYDKQFLRDWLVSTKQKGKPDVTVPEDIVKATSQRYLDAYKALVGSELGAETSKTADLLARSGVVIMSID